MRGVYGGLAGGSGILFILQDGVGNMECTDGRAVPGSPGVGTGSGTLWLRWSDWGLHQGV